VAQGAKSRLGFKVVEQIDADWSAKVELEHRLKPDTGAINTTSTNQFWDMSTVAVTNKNFGEVKMGRDYMPMFYAQYLLDPWLNQGVAEIGGTSYAFAGYTNDAQRPVRYNNGLWYSVKAAGFTAIVATSRSESSTKSSRMGAAVMYSDGPLFVTAAYDRDDGENSSLYSSAYNAYAGQIAAGYLLPQQPPQQQEQLQSIANTSDKTDTLIQIGAAYDFGFVKPRISYVRTKQYNASLALQPIRPPSPSLQPSLLAAIW
jgi:predicted porin